MDYDLTDNSARLPERRILCAMDSFKETLSAVDACKAVSAGIQRIRPNWHVENCPVGDGGEGTMHALLSAAEGHLQTMTVSGPLEQYLDATFGIIDQRDKRIGIVELAEASGLALLSPDERNPLRTTTYGTGQLMRAAINAGCTEIIVCLGGSGTVDGGLGLAQALGAVCYDTSGRMIERAVTGGDLQRIARIDPPGNLPYIRAACDVTNPLLGASGAAAVYGPQKGADETMVVELEANLHHLAHLTGADPEYPGSGAAGGAGYGLLALCHAELERGIDVVLSALDFDTRCRDCDLIVTGEGRLDEQSIYSKAVCGVAQASREAGKPVIAIVGSTGPGAEATLDSNRDCGLTAYYSLTDRFGSKAARSGAAACIETIAADIVREFT